MRSLATIIVLGITACRHADGTPSSSPDSAAKAASGECRQLGFGCGSLPHSGALQQAAAAVERTDGDLRALLLELKPLQSEWVSEDEILDFAAHLFPFDHTHPDEEVERAFAELEDPRLANVFLRGLFIQWGYDHFDDPNACNTFYQRYPQVGERERAFGMGNGVAWGWVNWTPPDAAPDAAPDIGLAVEISHGLVEPVRTMFLEELGWQLVSRNQTMGEGHLPALSAAFPMPDYCTVLHGIVRGKLRGVAGLAEATSMAEQMPEACRMHVLHAAQRQRCPSPIQIERAGGMLEPCGVAEHELRSWMELDQLP